MAFQALKEAKISATRCRLTPPSSPTKRLSFMPPTTKPVYKSKVLAALDAELDVFGSSRQPPPPPSRKVGAFPPRPSASRQFSTLAPPLESGTLGSGPSHSARSRPAKEVVALEDTEDAEDEGELLEELPRQLRGEEDLDNDSPEANSSHYPDYKYQDYGCKPVTVYTRSEDEANDLIACLRQPFGFDMEWRVFYKRRSGPEGRTIMLERPTAVVQLADPSMILVIQLGEMKFPAKLKEILESEHIWKCGVNIRNDALKLYRDFGIECRQLAELGAMAHQADRTFHLTHKRNIVSLQKMVAMYLHKNMLKPPVRTSNWETVPLTAEQIEYAANDAHSALMVFRRLRRIATLQRRNHLNNNRADYTVDIWREHHPRQRKPINGVPVGPIVEPPTPESIQRAFERQRGERAYRMWYEGGYTLNEVSTAFNRGSALVIRYILGALEADPSLPYDIKKLEALVLRNPQAREYFKEWRKRVVQEPSEPTTE